MDDRPPIDVRPDLWAIVRNILRRHVPESEVWAFGSRATGKAKRYSDLDLAIMSDTGLPLAVRAELEEAFSESDLPWRVDVVDWATTSPTFQAIIMRDKVVLQRARAPIFCAEETAATGVRCRDMSRPEAANPRSNPKIAPEPVPPGGRAALPEGSLPKPFLQPQGDENRDPPANAPAPVAPTETVKNER
jgi:predicted nucleotidyltransferase